MGGWKWYEAASNFSFVDMLFAVSTKLEDFRDPRGSNEMPGFVIAPRKDGAELRQGQTCPILNQEFSHDDHHLTPIEILDGIVDLVSLWQVSSHRAFEAF